MKKIVLAMAAFAFSFGVMSAQDLATATATYNSGAEALTMGNKTSALEYFQKALTMAQSLGDEGADVVTNCKSAIPSVILSIGKDFYNNKDFTNAKAKFEEAIKVAGEYGNTDINSIIGNDKDYAFEDSESFAKHGFTKQEFDNEELVDVEEEEPEDIDESEEFFDDEVLDEE